MIQRKCPTCKSWNNDEDYCTSCGTALSATAIEKERQIIREKQTVKKKPLAIELFLERSRGSKNIFVRISYYTAYSFFLFVGAIGAFAAWLAALANA